jgi:peptidoglycan/xylan/chitin deacetylase (PgdA/CDA1 family)
MNQRIGSRLLKILAAADGGALAGALRASLGERRVAVCFHRVAERRREGELQPKLTMPPAEIDRLIRFLLEAVPGAPRALTVSFDDGYRDSADYVLSRAPLFPKVEWLFFVCPEKTERQAGFRWDLAETRRRAAPGLDVDAILFAPVEVATENQREELRRLPAQPDFQMADLAMCREIQRLPNVALGNHTNVHHRPALMSADQFRAECEASTRDFARLFGPLAHFAFPFGVPGHDFTSEHVAALHGCGRFLLWSTEPRPFEAGERAARSVLPRFAVDGTRTWKETAAQILLHALRTRVRNPLRRSPRAAGAFAAGILEGSASR